MNAIRQATIHDLDKIAPLFDAYRQFYGRPADIGTARSFLAERFKHHESIVFLALDAADVALGFTQLYPLFSSVNAGRKYLLNDLFVVPSARRARVAGQLLEAATEFARTQGALSLSLSTAIANTPAQQLYESLGWKRDHEYYEYNLKL